MNKPRVLVEAAVDTLEDAVAGAAAGVDRLELCGDLSVGGITPDRPLLLSVLDRVSIPVLVMIRPRGGDFVYSPEEAAQMLRDIDFVKTAKAAGIVTGALTHGGDIDLATMRDLMKAADGLPVTFHRASDRIKGRLPIEQLVELGVARILTSGGARTAIASAEALAAYVNDAGEDIAIVAGGGVRAANVREIVQRTGVREVHARFTDSIEMRNMVVAARNV